MSELKIGIDANIALVYIQEGYTVGVSARDYHEAKRVWNSMMSISHYYDDKLPMLNGAIMGIENHHSNSPQWYIWGSASQVVFLLGYELTTQWHDQVSWEEQRLFSILCDRLEPVNSYGLWWPLNN